MKRSVVSGTFALTLSVLALAQAQDTTRQQRESLIKRLADAIAATILLDGNDGTQVYFVGRNLACRKVSGGDYRSRILIRKYNYMVEQARNFNIDEVAEAAEDLLAQINASDRFSSCWKTIVQDVGVASQNVERAIQIVAADKGR